MKRFIAIILSAFLLLMPAGGMTAEADNINYIILTDDEFDVQRFCREFDAKIIYSYESIGGYAISADKSKAAKINDYKGIVHWEEDVAFPGAEPVSETEADFSHSSFRLMGETGEYRGEGALVAVIDAGCNVSHTTFKITDGNLSLTKERVAELLESEKFNAEARMSGLSENSVYKNAKFPFAFDYGDGDINVSGVSHGSGVCSVLAGNGGSYNGAPFSGVLPEAQICFMKVQNSAGGISPSDMIAAIEDAILLGVEGINISIGAASGFGATPGEAVFESAINKAREKGIYVTVSAGNSGMLTAEGSYSEFAESFARPYNENTDYGVMGSPAVFENSIAVGSSTDNGLPSAFSSIGCGPSMELKPEICASANSIVVANNSGFTVSRGTSYAAPVILGNLIKVKNKFRESENGEKIAELLLMNTADIMRKNNIPVSPRKQGSGNVNSFRALEGKAIIYGKEGKGKINLKDNLSENFSGEFIVENISEERVEYTPSLELITDETNRIAITGNSVLLSQSAVFEPATVILHPGEAKTVKFSVKVSEEQIRKNEELFKNGFFLEGFISLNGEELLSIPFMGYYGSWNSAPLFIPPDVKYGFGFATVMLNREYKFANTYYYGNPFFINMGISNPHSDISKITFSPNGDRLLDTANILTGFYRNALYLKLVFKDASGKIVREMLRNEIPKGAGMSSVSSADYRWDGKDSEGKLCAEGIYYLTATAKTAYGGAAEESITLPIIIDCTSPVLEKAEAVTENDKIYLDAYYKDNGYIQTVAISGEDFTVYCHNPDERGAYRFDISGIGTDSFDIEAYDYGLNGCLDKITVADEYRVYYKENKINRIRKKLNAYINGNINSDYELEQGEDAFRIFIWNKKLMPLF